MKYGTIQYVHIYINRILKKNTKQFYKSHHRKKQQIQQSKVKALTTEKKL